MCVHIFQEALDYLISDNTCMSTEVNLVSNMCYQEKQKVQSLVESPENVLGNLTLQLVQCQ